MDEDWEFEETLRRLAGPVDRRGVWAAIEARAGVAPWSIGEQDQGKKGAGPRRARTHARWLTPRVAVFASVAVVLLAAVAFGSFMAVRNLTRPDFVLVINDETIIDAGSTGAAGATGATGATGTTSGMWERLSLTSDGGNVTCLVIDPSDSAVLYATTDDGLFKSQDAAGSWSRLTSMEYRVFLLAVDPASSSTIYALTDNPGVASAVSPARFLRSDDGGSTWEDLTAGSPRFMLWPPIVWIDAVSSPSEVYTYDQSGSLWRSADRGETWTQLSREEADQAEQTAPGLQGRDFTAGTVTDPQTGSVFTEVAGPIDPTDPSILYAGTPEGVYKSTDGGQTWNKASAGLTSAAVWRLITDPSSASILYAATSVGIFKTTDGGATWDMILGGLGSVVLAPSSPSTLYAWTSAGLFRSNDGGMKWAELAATGLAPRPEGWGPMFGGLVLVAADDPDTLFAASGAEFRQLFRSTDGGNSWNQVLYYSGSLVADPGDPSTLYATTFSGEMSGSGALVSHVSKSTDRGSTWATVSPAEWTDAITELVIDPSSPSNVYVFLQIGSGSYTVSRSDDGGVTWENVGLEGAGKYLDQVRFDPHSPDRLYVLTSQATESDSEQGLYRSEDGGGTWLNIGGELADGGIVDIVVDSAPGGALYAVTESGLFKWAAEDDGKDATTATPAVSTTARQGRVVESGSGSWEGVPLPEIPGIDGRIFVVGMDPNHASTLYVKLLEEADIPRLIRSDDGGATWADLSDALPLEVADVGGFMGPIIMFDATTDPSTVYTYCGPSLWRSTDRGESWNRLSAEEGDKALALMDVPRLPASAPASARQALEAFPAALGGTVTYVLLDPRSADVLYVLTDQGSKAGLYRTTDAGATWQNIVGGILDEDIQYIAIDPESGELYASAMNRGLYKWVPETE